MVLHGLHGGGLGCGILNQARSVNLWKGQGLPEGIFSFLHLFHSRMLSFFPNHEKLSKASRLAFLIDLVNNDGY